MTPPMPPAARPIGHAIAHAIVSVKRISSSSLQSAPVAPQSMDRRNQRRRAQDEAAEAEGDDDDVPERTMVVEKRKVEAVETVIEPAVHAREPFFLAHDRAAPRVEIEPRPLRIGVADTQHRQRERAASVVVVGVVLVQPRRVGDVGIRHRRACRGNERVAIESDRSVVRNQERFTAKLREFEFPGSPEGRRDRRGR